MHVDIPKRVKYLIVSLSSQILSCKIWQLLEAQTKFKFTKVGIEYHSESNTNFCAMQEKIDKKPTEKTKMGMDSTKPLSFAEKILQKHGWSQGK